MLRRCTHASKSRLLLKYSQSCVEAVGRRHGSTDPQLKDVHIGSLTDTLEAHRASNRARLIRKIQHDDGKLEKTAASNRHLRSTRSPPTHDDRGNRHGKDKTKQDELAEKPPSPTIELPCDKEHVQMRKWLDNEKVLRSFGSYIAPITDWVVPTQWTKEREARMCRPYIDPDEEPLTSLEKPHRLTTCVRALEAWLEITTEEKLARQKLTNWITQRVQEICSDEVTLRLFGSELTGLAMPSSDVDLGLHAPSIHDAIISSSTYRKNIMQILSKIHKHLSSPGKVSVVFQPSKHFPLLRCVFERSKHEIQIVSSPSSEISTELVKGYLAEFPQLRPIYLVVRLVLQARLLHTPAVGGLGSYCLIMMLVKFLRSGQTSRRDDLGHTLTKFLQYWATRNTNDYAFCPDPPAIWKKRDPSMAVPKQVKILQRNDPLEYERAKMAVRKPDRPFLLAMQDPAQWDNDVGVGTFRIMDIRKTFGKLAGMLEQWHENSNNADNDPLDRFFGSRLARIQTQRAALVTEAELEWLQPKAT